MFSECANPACRAEFDYRQGQFFRLYKRPLDDGQPANTHSIEHFWLCGRCSETYCLEQTRSGGLLIRLRLEKALGAGSPQMVPAD
jgi:hypothetical protein